MSLMVTLHQTVAELFDSMLGRPVSCPSILYSITLCSLQEAPSDIISGLLIKDVGTDAFVKFGYSRSKFSSADSTATNDGLHRLQQ